MEGPDERGARRGTERSKTMIPEKSRWHLPGDLVMLVYRDETRGRAIARSLCVVRFLRPGWGSSGRATTVRSHLTCSLSAQGSKPSQPQGTPEPSPACPVMPCHCPCRVLS